MVKVVKFYNIKGPHKCITVNKKGRVTEKDATILTSNKIVGKERRKDYF